uniref:Uncharacterized protein n=1 Tax=Chlamydomonas leiostraca TaxID=1034604 RepID=A0A7S0R8N5_9CHLO|mmetsp:Transcript_16542/g.41287  ORF Transcript_16542/g.41287 Transcript_16542/m.41287 type:complete len:230 (+) Transcript_16542:50-739(+)
MTANLAVPHVHGAWAHGRPCGMLQQAPCYKASVALWHTRHTRHTWNQWQQNRHHAPHVCLATTGEGREGSKPRSASRSAEPVPTGDMPAVQALANTLQITASEAANMCKKVPKLLRRSPSALAAKVNTISAAAGVPAARIASLVARGSPSVLLHSPSVLLDRLEAMAGLLGLEPEGDLGRVGGPEARKSVLGQALAAAEADPTLLQMDFDGLRGVGKAVMRELRDAGGE